MIDAKEFCLLFDINRSNGDFEYWNFGRFDLYKMSDDDCIAELWFVKHDIPRVKHVLRLPQEFRCTLCNNFKISSTEALCILVKRLAYPCRYSDMINRFGRATPELCMAFNQILDIVENHFVARLEPGLTYFKSFATFCSYYLQIIQFYCPWKCLGFHWWNCENVLSENYFRSICKMIIKNSCTKVSTTNG